MATGAELRRIALKGGAYLVGRQLVSILLKLIGVVLITRVLGPAGYGAYVSAVSIYQYALLLGQAGIGVYLLRHEGEVSETAYRTAYTVLLAASFLLVGAILAGTDALRSWIGVEGFETVMRVIVWGIPFQLLAVPATVRLERSFDFRAIALLEIAGQIAFYALAVPLVLLHHGPVALGVSWVVQQAVTAILAHLVGRRVPRFGFDRRLAADLVRYASTFSVANWIWQLRMLVNPLIVGPALGATAVGLVGMTIGLLEMLSVIKSIVWRLSVAVLRTVQTDPARIRKAVTEGMELQTLAVGAILLGFAWTGHLLVPLVFGARWLPVMDLYPFVALSYFAIAPFNMHSAVLSTLNRNGGLALYHLAHVLVFFAGSYLLVPAYGIAGYGYAEVATLPVYLLLHLLLVRAIGSPDYRVTALWWVAGVVGLFWRQIGLWAIAVPFLALALPVSLRKIRGYASLLRSKAG